MVILRPYLSIFIKKTLILHRNKFKIYPDNSKTMNKYTDVLRKSMRSLNLFDYVLIGSICALSLVSFYVKGEFNANIFIAALSAVLGVFCVVLGAKGSLANWIIGTVECILHIYICFVSHIYGDFLQRIFWNLPMQFFGWKNWRKRERHDNTTSIRTRYMTWNQRGITVLAVGVLTFVLGLFLQNFGPWMIGVLKDILPDMQFKTLKADYDFPALLWFDAFTTVASIVALFISIKAYVEQWYLWLSINITSLCIWIFQDTEFSFMTIAKYGVYLVNTFYGIYMWNKLSKE